MLTLHKSLSVGLLVGAGLACNTTTITPTVNPPNSAGPAFAGVATQAATPPPPLAGGSLIVMRVQDKPMAIVSDADEDRIDVVDLTAKTVAGTIQLQPGDEPGRLVADSLGQVHVALRSGGAVVTIDPATFSTLYRRDVCPAPRGIDFDSVTKLVYVACATGELVTLDAVGNPPLRTVHLDRDLRDVTVSGTQLFISRFRSAEMLVVDAALGTVNGRQVPDTLNESTPDVAWRSLLAPSGVVMLHQLASTKPLDVAPAQSYYATGGGIVSGAVSVMSANGHSTQAIFVTAPVIDLAIAQTGVPLILDLDGNITDGTGSALAYGSSLAGNNAAPNGTAVEFVALADSRVAGGTVMVVQQRSPSAGLVLAPFYDTGELNASAAMTVKLPQSASHIDTGFDVFHVATSVGAACMHCHPEGGDDGHTWTFVVNGTDRVRRTQSLRGGTVGGTAPYHWDGDIPDLQGLCDEVFTHRMGGGSMSTKQTAVLAHWLQSIPRIPARSDLDPTAVAAGQALFTTQGCNTCHAGARGTSATNADIGKTDSLGVSKPMQIPMLLGVADRAPYMHDGCANTLMDRLTNTKCGGTNHGDLTNLTDADRQNLITYLESL